MTIEEVKELVQQLQMLKNRIRWIKGRLDEGLEVSGSRMSETEVRLNDIMHTICMRHTA